MNISLIPTEILNYTSTFLDDPKNVASARLTCKNFNRIFSDRYFQLLCMNRWGIDSATLKVLRESTWKKTYLSGTKILMLWRCDLQRTKHHMIDQDLNAIATKKFSIIDRRIERVNTILQSDEKERQLQYHLIQELVGGKEAYESLPSIEIYSNNIMQSLRDRTFSHSVFTGKYDTLNMTGSRNFLAFYVKIFCSMNKEELYCLACIYEKTEPIAAWGYELLIRDKISEKSWDELRSRHKDILYYPNWLSKSMKSDVDSDHYLSLQHLLTQRKLLHSSKDYPDQYHLYKLAPPESATEDNFWSCFLY